MSFLVSLVEAYNHLPDAPPYGYSKENIGIVVGLHADGTVATVTDWRIGEGKKAKSRPMLVPQPVKRASNIAPNFLWDKTAYVLGITAGNDHRTAQEHQAFIDRHIEVIGDNEDPGLQALLLFLQNWKPEHFVPPLWPEDFKDLNLIFALESERKANIYLHDRPAAKELWEKLSDPADEEERICLVTGEKRAIARLHPSIKGVWGGQSAGGSLVSFNQDSFNSFNLKQGDNAPVSKAASFAYTTVLNHFLQKDSGHRLQIGDTSTVYWADASEVSQQAETLFSMFIDNADEKNAENQQATSQLDEKLKLIRQGIALEQIEPKLAQGVRFYVLGLAPNAARISIRFYFEDDFGQLTRNYQRFVSDMRISPPPQWDYPPLWRYLNEIAVLGKKENIPPNLAGEWMRSILSGTRYPATLMAIVLMRIRADGKVNALRAGLLKALLIRNFNREAPVALDPQNDNKGYLLGRLFAVYEQIQLAALGSKVNATIKDKFYGSASAQPRKIFHLLESGSANHLSKLGKQRPGSKVFLEKQIAAIMDLMDPASDPFPATLPTESQALFGLGYYHQRNEFFKRQADTATAEEILA